MNILPSMIQCSTIRICYTRSFITLAAAGFGGRFLNRAAEFDFKIHFSVFSYTSGFPFAVCSAMTILTAVEVLHYLELWDESYWVIMNVVPTAPSCKTF